MADWLNLIPEGGPEGVEQARAAAQALNDRIPEDRAALEASRGELTKAEQHDRQQLADAMRAGEEGLEPAPDYAFMRGFDQIVDPISHPSNEGWGRVVLAHGHVVVSHVRLNSARELQAFLDDTVREANRIAAERRSAAEEAAERDEDLTEAFRRSG